MLYFRFILAEGNSSIEGRDQSAVFNLPLKIYSYSSRGKGKVPCLDALADACIMEDVKKLTAKYGKYAVVSFEGSSIFSIEKDSDDSLARQVAEDKLTFASNPYWKNKDMTLFVRRSRIIPLLDLLKSSGIAVMKWQLADYGRQEEHELEMYLKESLAEGLSFSGLRNDPEGLFSYMCFRLDSVKFVTLAAMLFIVMSDCLLSRFLSDKISDASAELEAIRRRTGESIEMEKDAVIIMSGLGAGIFPPASYIIDRLSVLKPKGILYTKVSITGKVITAAGNVTDSDSLVRLADSLEEEDHITGCSISSIKTGKNGTQSFMLEISLK